MSLFSELKRRNVFRVAVAYVVAAWLVLQVVDVVQPILKFPDWVAQLTLLAMGLGFSDGVVDRNCRIRAFILSSDEPLTVDACLELSAVVPLHTLGDSEATVCVSSCPAGPVVGVDSTKPDRFGTAVDRDWFSLDFNLAPTES